MSEYKNFENNEANDMILKYSDVKYNFAILRRMNDISEPYIWLLVETKEDAIEKLKIETNGYYYNPNENDMENFNFYVAKIERTEYNDSRGQRISVNLNNIEELNSSSVRQR